MKNKIISVICVFVISLYVFIPFTFANNTSTLPEDVLIRTNGIDIKKTTKIEEIKKIFGNSTLETVSPFGGKMYTFYNESKRTNLYVETNSEGNIKNIGVISEEFRSHNYDALKEGKNGDYDYRYSEKNIYRYTNDKMCNMGVTVCNYNYSERSAYINEYVKNQAKNLYNLEKHAIYTAKMLAYIQGKKFTQTVAPEEIFYMNELLKTNKETLYNVLWNNNKYKYVYGLGGRSYFESNVPSDIPANPVYMGSHGIANNIPEDYKYIIYDIGNTPLDNGKYYTGYYWYAINPDFMKEKKTVELNDEEKAKLNNVKKLYDEFNSYYEKSEHQEYTTEPDIKKLAETQVYGTMNENYLKAAVAYLNMARAGIGLEKLKFDKQLSQYAQIKAATVVYLNTYTDKHASHEFDKPIWMSEEDYENSGIGNENLYMGGYIGGHLFGSIGYALNDAHGDPVTCGHRYNIINPHVSKVGLGFAGGQGCHKFTGYSSESPELVAWPANGIMPMALISNAGIGNWTATFFDGKHQFTDNTTVTIKNLNTGVEWNITKTEGNNKFLRKVSDGSLTFRDDSVAYEVDDVLEITLTNVKYSDGSIKDYKYRSAFKGFSSTESKEITSISTIADNIVVELGKTKDLKIRLNPDDATNKLTYVSSDNSAIATVRADGLVTAKKIGKTTATIKCGNITKKVNIEVVDKIPVPITEIKLNKANLNIAINGSEKLTVTINPTDTTENKTINWTSSNTKVVAVDKTGTVKGIEEGTAVVTAKVGNKTASCKVTVEYKLPFKDVAKSDWFYEPVKWAYKNKVVTGYNETTFAPNDKTSRGQLVTILWRLEGKPDTSKLKNNFTDVENTYYTEAIKWANSKGIVTGYGGTTKFGPEDRILRQDLALILMRYAKYKGKDTTKLANISGFADYKKAQNYAETAIRWAVQNSIIQGNKKQDGTKTLDPQSNATRAEIVTMLMRYCQK